MEVEVLGVDGVAQDAVISIRAGATRRQAAVSACGKPNAPFKFSGGPAGVNPFKIDILQQIGSTRLALKPGGGTFAVPIKGTEGVTVNLRVRDAQPKATSLDVGQDLFDRIDADKDGIISRREFNDALVLDGDKPSLQPLDKRSPIPVAPAPQDSKDRLPPLPKDDDGRFPAAATAAKNYLDSHELLPFVRALLQTVVRERPDDPYGFIADQFRDASALTYKPVPVAEPVQTTQSKLAGLAQASVDGTLPQQLEQAQAQLEQLQQQLTQAQAKAPEDAQAAPRGDALEEALESQATKMGADFGKLGPQERKEATYKAQEALGKVISEATEAKVAKAAPATAPTEAVPNVAEAKERARQALQNALFTNELLSDDEMSQAKDKAQDALMRSLSQQQEQEASQDALKRSASSALETALLGGDDAAAAPSSQDMAALQSAKLKARDALNAALMSDDGQQDVVGIQDAKQKARDALNAALLGGDDRAGSNSTEIVELKAEIAALKAQVAETAKDKARAALNAALLDDSEDGSRPQTSEVEVAKSKAREALALSLLGGEELEDAIQDEVEQAKAVAREALASVLLAGDDADAALQSTLKFGDSAPSAAKMELAKQSARDVLSKALLAEASGPQDANASKEEKQANLAATKAQMSKMNRALKDEIGDLNANLDALSKQRDALREKMR